MLETVIDYKFTNKFAAFNAADKESIEECIISGFIIIFAYRKLMSDTLTHIQRHYCMSQVRSSNTKPEIELRHALWLRGFRYRINDPRLPGKPDVLLPKYRTALFVHGCFWHGHLGCKRYTVPKTNLDYWEAKVARNKQRDEEVWRQLEAKGWSVVIVWECEIDKKEFNKTMDRVVSEIISNGNMYQKRMQERKMIREQRLAERRVQKERYEAFQKEQWSRKV